MIAGLKGRIERKLDDAALIDVGGVIYRVNTSLVTLEDIGDAGESVRLFTHLYVREDQLTLAMRYGQHEVSPDPGDVAMYEILFTTVYQRFYPSVAPLSQRISDLQASVGVRDET